MAALYCHLSQCSVEDWDIVFHNYWGEPKNMFRNHTPFTQFWTILIFNILGLNLSFLDMIDPTDCIDLQDTHRNSLYSSRQQGDVKNEIMEELKEAKAADGLMLFGIMVSCFGNFRIFQVYKYV